MAPPIDLTRFLNAEGQSYRRHPVGSYRSWMARKTGGPPPKQLLRPNLWTQPDVYIGLVVFVVALAASARTKTAGNYLGFLGLGLALLVVLVYNVRATSIWVWDDKIQIRSSLLSGMLIQGDGTVNRAELKRIVVANRYMRWQDSHGNDLATSLAQWSNKELKGIGHVLGVPIVSRKRAKETDRTEGSV